MVGWVVLVLELRTSKFIPPPHLRHLVSKSDFGFEDINPSPSNYNQNWNFLWRTVSRRLGKPEGKVTVIILGCPIPMEICYTKEISQKLCFSGEVDILTDSTDDIFATPLPHFECKLNKVLRNMAHPFLRNPAKCA